MQELGWSGTNEDGAAGAKFWPLSEELKLGVTLMIDNIMCTEEADLDIQGRLESMKG